MILSNIKIQEALDNKWLIIEPEPRPRRRTLDAPECPYQTSSVDLRLGSEVAWMKPGLGLSFNLREGGFPALFGTASESRQLQDDHPFQLEPGKFVLGKTLERVELPAPKDATTPCLAARIEGRSSYARCGLLVHFTAPTIHAGYNGTITLEMKNLGDYPILLLPGAYICQLILEQVDGIPFPNESQFQGQSSPGGAAS